MQDVFLINMSLKNSTIKSKLKSLKDSIVISTKSINEFKDKAIGYSKNGEIDSIYAVGGDGTVNLLASILVNTNKKLGIVPIGHHNRIYNSILNSEYIDIGYINDQIFLNHAILFNDSNFDLSFENKNSFKELKKFEIASNIKGKYQILKMNSLVISNNNICNNNYDITDGLMEACIINGKERFFDKEKDTSIKTNGFTVDALGSIGISIDGDFYSVTNFDFKVMNKGIHLALPIQKRLELKK